MPPDWDESSEELVRNLRDLLRAARDDAKVRRPITLNVIRSWHPEMLTGIDVPNRRWIGRFRGEAGLKTVKVRVGGINGTPPLKVTGELDDFESRLSALITYLDASIELGGELDGDQLNAVVEASSWAHAEWVRIHPFVNGNGRIARVLANAIAMRYGLPPFVRLRPRPNDGYTEASHAAMRGEWQLTASCFRQMLSRLLGTE